MPLLCPGKYLGRWEVARQYLPYMEGDGFLPSKPTTFTATTRTLNRTQYILLTRLTSREDLALFLSKILLDRRARQVVDLLATISHLR